MGEGRSEGCGGSSVEPVVAEWRLFRIRESEVIRIEIEIEIDRGS